MMPQVGGMMFTVPPESLGVAAKARLGKPYTDARPVQAAAAPPTPRPGLPDWAFHDFPRYQRMRAAAAEHECAHVGVAVALGLPVVYAAVWPTADGRVEGRCDVEPTAWAAADPRDFAVVYAAGEAADRLAGIGGTQNFGDEPAYTALGAAIGFDPVARAAAVLANLSVQALQAVLVGRMLSVGHLDAADVAAAVAQVVAVGGKFPITEPESANADD